MKLLIGDKDHFDFDDAVLMTQEQRDKFIDMMKELFSVVQLEKTDKFRLERLGDKIFARNWTTEELKYLLEIKDINTICEGLGRSWMSVDIKRGAFIPLFMVWAHEMGYDIVHGDIKSLIEKFVEDKELEKRERKEAKRNNSIEALQLKINKLNVKQDSIYRRRRVGLKYAEDEKILSDINAQILDLEHKISMGSSKL
ncbi:MAG TPA: hypothetical protein PLK94_03085 [Alphaproteobacteria bacterium]|nr:hypothetical protein [Alphaproteobacteria bacterium]